MKLYALVHPGFETLAQQEILELVQKKSTISPLVVEVEVDSPQEILTLLTRGQSFRRLLLAIDKFPSTEKVQFDIKFPWKDIFTNETIFKIDVEGLSGQENRFDLAREMAGKLFALFDKLELKPKMDLKKPQSLVMAFYNEKEYFLGIDLAGKELNSRPYRVFPHQASFKGDSGYYFVRKVGFTPESKLAVAFCKDGVMAVEAALYATKTPTHHPIRENFSCIKFPLFADVKIDFPLAKPIENVTAFDESMQNVIAAKKNMHIAKVNFSILRYSLEELDIKHEENTLDQIIFHLTSKDEDKINDIYRQSLYVLKKKGRLLFIARDTYDPSVSDKFKLIEKSKFCRGNSCLGVWLLEKK